VTHDAAYKKSHTSAQYLTSCNCGRQPNMHV